MRSELTDKCKNCGKPIIRDGNKWYHAPIKGKQSAYDQRRHCTHIHAEPALKMMSAKSVTKNEV